MVDAVVLNVFLLATTFVVVVLISGVSQSIFWLDRIIMLIPNIIMVEPYNRVRIWTGNKLGVWRSQRLHQIMRDTITFILCRVPLVFIVLPLLGAPLDKVFLSAVVATLISGFIGRPYGIFLDKARKVFSV